MLEACVQPMLCNKKKTRKKSERERYISNSIQKLTEENIELNFTESPSFRDKLFEHIEKSGMTNVDIYTKANIDKKLFSKIKTNENYIPTKRTILALTMALELNLEETKDLLQRAGYALSPSFKFDIIIEYFLKEDIYDVYFINLALNEHGLPMLGEQ